MKKARGFTLVELMVVVAILGILAGVGIPQFKKYQAKSKTTEAKIQLVAAYSAQISFDAEYDTYANCYPIMGFNPSSEVANRYYWVGTAFCNLNGNAEANGAVGCVSPIGLENYSHFHAGKTTNPSIALDYEDDDNGVVNVGVFTAVAHGWISQNSGSVDYWEINQNKKLTHVIVGY